MADLQKVRQVRRCLFGKPTEAESARFSSIVAAENAMTARRFEESWGLDLQTDSPIPGGVIDWIKTTDVPDVYKKGYIHKCKQRLAMTAMDSVNNFLYFHSDDSSDSVRSNVAQDCTSCESERVDVFVGTRRQQESTPVRPEEDRTKPPLTDSSTDQKVKTKIQRRLLDCDRWVVRKKRSRSVTPEAENSPSSAKRQRVESS